MRCIVFVLYKTLTLCQIRHIVLDKAGQTAELKIGEIAMTHTKLVMLNDQDRGVSRILLGFLTAPLGILLGMGLLIAL